MTAVSGDERNYLAFAIHTFIAIVFHWQFSNDTFICALRCMSLYEEKFREALNKWHLFYH